MEFGSWEFVKFFFVVKLKNSLITPDMIIRPLQPYMAWPMPKKIFRLNERAVNGKWSFNVCIKQDWLLLCFILYRVSYLKIWSDLVFNIFSAVKVKRQTIGSKSKSIKVFIWPKAHNCALPFSIQQIVQTILWCCDTTFSVCVCVYVLRMCVCENNNNCRLHFAKD